MYFTCKTTYKLFTWNIWFFSLLRQTNKNAQDLQNKHTDPVRDRRAVSRAAQQIGDEDSLHQTGNHQSQAEREEDIWKQERVRNEANQ